jgi:WXXGXW repeat (2 copies)
MKNLIQTFVISAVFALSASAASAQVSIGIHIGPPPAPRTYRVPPQPGPDYTWVEGYWYPQGSRYRWHDGYWTRPPYAGAYWVAPYHAGNQYYAGRWEGNRGNVVHDHRWDKSRARDEHHDPHRGRDDRR